MNCEANTDPLVSPSAPLALSPASLETRFAALLAQFEASESERIKLQGAHDQLKADKRYTDLKIQKLTLELAQLRRLRFGAKSEAMTAVQRTLFEESMDEDIAAVEAMLDAPAPTERTRAPRIRAGRQPLPDHLERVEVRHEPESCTCAQCQSSLTLIREDVTEQLDVQPSRFFVIRHIRPQYTCRSCETVTAAPAEPAIIDSGMAAPGLLAWVAVSKYLDHLPLYRIEQIAARQNVVLARSTLSEWMGHLGVALQPLADRLSQILRARESLHADETPVQQLDPGSGKTKRAYLWAYRSNDLTGDPSIVVFDYQKSRSGHHARSFLKDWTGHLCVDDYGGYKALFSGGVTEVACWAHARRKFFDLDRGTPQGHPVAASVVSAIGALYAIEAQARALTPEARLQIRQADTLPKLEALHEQLTEIRSKASQGCHLAKACDYLLRRWSAFTRYAYTGHLPIDNNPVENAIRPIALGKKNWLFTGSERAGQRAAAIQSLLATAKLNGLDPATWLKDTLEKLPVWLNSRIDELLPLKP
jgi:transposase